MARAWAARAALLVAGLVAGVALAEAFLFAIGRPRVYTPRTRPAQFGFLASPSAGISYLNAPSRVIRFVYDGNPRGYFGDANEVDHVTNALGFRGPELDAHWSEDGTLRIGKPAGSVRIVFVGDSFTFGEGVRFEDTFAERTAALLRERTGRDVQAVNLGVGGYDTAQERDVLRAFGLPADPDAVVLAYVPNDAEPPLFRWDPAAGRWLRTQRAVEEIAGPELPPRDGIFALRSARLLWQLRRRRALTASTLAYYRSLYDDAQPAWRETRDALREVAAICRERELPCLVLLFPLLHRLDDYPLRDVHEKILAELAAVGLATVDLLPRLAGRPAESLWVHPTDQHPNEIVHEIAARALAEEIARRGLGGARAPDP